MEKVKAKYFIHPTSSSPLPLPLWPPAYEKVDGETITVCKSILFR